MYSFYPDSEHEKRVLAYFKEKGGEFGLSSETSDKSLFLCFTNRCGSTLLSSKLSMLGIFGKPSDYKNYEFFNGDEVVDYCRRNNITSFVRYIGDLIEKYSAENNMFSSKVSIDQLVWLTRNNILLTKLKNPYFIFSYRKDVISQAISLSIAMQNGKWTSNHKGTSDIPLEYSEKQITSYIFMIMKSNAMFEVYFAQHDIKPIRISYEGMLTDDSLVERKLRENNIEICHINKPTFNTKKQGGDINKEWHDRYIGRYKSKIFLGK